MCDTVDTPYKCGHKGIDRIVCGIKKKAQFEFQEVVLTMPVCVNTPSCCPIVGCFTKAVELVYLMNWPVNIIRV